MTINSRQCSQVDMACIEIDSNVLGKALTTIVIQNTFLKVGIPVYKITQILEKEYNCFLPDCYEHPEYLKNILEKLYGGTHSIIIESINKELGKDFSQRFITKFVQH